MVKLRPTFFLVGCVELTCDWAEGYDGSAWEMQPKAQRVIRARYEAAKALRRAAEFDDSYIDFRRKGHLARVAALETFLGRPVYRIDMVLVDGLLVSWYIDRETYLPVANRTRVPVHARGEHFDTITKLSDFRPAQNSSFLYPHKLTSIDPISMKEADTGGGWAAIVANIHYDPRQFSPPAVTPGPTTQAVLRLWATSNLDDAQAWIAPYAAARSGMKHPENSQEDLIWLAYEMLKENSLEKALVALRTSIKENGDSWDVYDSLGDAYAQFLDTSEARVSYEKALQLDPKAASTRRKLGQLQAAR